MKTSAATAVPTPREPWTLVAASATGRAHLERDQGNEDTLRSSLLTDGTLIMALADGAGSARRAAEGAGLVAEAAIAGVTERFEALDAPPSDEELRRILLDALAQARRRLAERLLETRAGERLRGRDLASTLLLAVIHRDALAVLQLGDGAVVARGPGGWQRVTEPLRGRHAGETVFASSRGAVREAQVEVLSLAGTSAVALLSDGLEPVATDMISGTPFGPFFEPLVPFVDSDRPVAELEADLTEFLGSERLQSRSFDDLSLMLAVRRQRG